MFHCFTLERQFLVHLSGRTSGCTFLCRAHFSTRPQWTKDRGSTLQVDASSLIRPVNGVLPGGMPHFEGATMGATDFEGSKWVRFGMPKIDEFWPCVSCEWTVMNWKRNGHEEGLWRFPMAGFGTHFVCLNIQVLTTQLLLSNSYFLIQFCTVVTEPCKALQKVSMCKQSVNWRDLSCSILSTSSKVSSSIVFFCMQMYNPSKLVFNIVYPLY